MWNHVEIHQKRSSNALPHPSTPQTSCKLRKLSPKCALCLLAASMCLLMTIAYILWLQWVFDGRGQQKHSVCDAHGPYQTIRSIMKPVFFTLSTDIYVVLMSGSCSCLDLYRRFLFMLTDDR
jgi:hypothetical protein